ncbi:MAG: phosphatase PAP2 family protein [Bacteroidales bacterium]
MIDYLVQLDTRLFLAINGAHSSFWDSIMLFASGKFSWIPLYLLLTFFIARRHLWRALFWLTAIAILVLLTDQISVHLFKNVFQRLRPSHNVTLSGLINIVDSRGGRFGFVSSHAANTFGVAVFLSFLFRKRRVTIGLLVWAFFVSYSRIYLGVHYPGDILGGAILGTFLGISAWQLAKRIIPVRQVKATGEA